MELAVADGVLNRALDDDDFLRANLAPPFGLDGVVARLQAGQTCVVNDISLCKADERQRVSDRIIAEVPSVDIHWYYFDNDALQCAANVILDRMHHRRTDAMDRVEAIRDYSWVYQPPLKETHRVWGVLPPLKP